MNEAAVNLDVHHPSDVEADAPQVRVFGVAGCGGFQLSGCLSSVYEYFRPDEVDSFCGPREMRDKATRCPVLDGIARGPWEARLIHRLARSSRSVR